jgi:hypothetical protein
MQVSGFSTSVAFPGAVPGDSVTVPGAQSYRIITNHPGGATIAMRNANGGWHTAVGQPDVMDNSALKVRCDSGTLTMPHDGTITLASVPVGDHSYTDDWTLSIPGGLTFKGDLNAQYEIVVSAA